MRLAFEEREREKEACSRISEFFKRGIAVKVWIEA